jgi:hypothetical protein
MTTRVRSWLAYPKDAPFPIGLLFFEIAHGTGKRAYTDLKEYQPKKKIQNRNKTKILLCKKFKKCIFKLYTSGFDCNGRILGKWKPF